MKSNGTGFKKRIIRYTWLSLLCIVITISLGKTLNGAPIKKIGIVSGIGIDLDGDQYNVTLQVISPALNGKTNTGSLPTTVYHESGKTILDGIRKIKRICSRRLFFDDTKLIIIQDEAVKKNKLPEIIHLLIREKNISSLLSIVITKDVKANVILRTFTPVQSINADRLLQMLETEQDIEGDIYIVHPNSIQNDLLDKKRELAIPYMTINGDPNEGTEQSNVESFEPPSLYEIRGMAYFKGTKLKGMLSPSESKMLVLLENKLNSSSYESKCNDGEGFVNMFINQSKTKLNASMKNGKPVLSANISIKGQILDSNCHQSFSGETIEKYNGMFSASIKKNVKKLIKKSQEEKSDFIGFGKALYIHEPSQWVKAKKHWNEIYPEARVYVNVHVNLTDAGDSYKLE
ncbi:Ger(x)C family spore germination protein [Falsibacillus albus]|uniref:Ger(X)C family spore germination protein n=1 Tax=Falsibacillus albus TaxID=2478915 RepID=A0A3L7K4A9_9BACI|nr:Ger(x)C family spore germination protein [Falsibacillus albus]RLQ95552.1 Ger(x)C family spore germination protein [Falsibacillus albus]